MIMSHIQDATIQDAERLVLSFFSAAIGSMSNVSIFAIQAIEAGHLKFIKRREELDEGGEKNFQRFKELLRRKPPEAVYSMRVLDEQMNDYKRFLKEHRKIFVVVDDLATDSQIIMFRGRDKDTVEKIKDLVDTIHTKKGEIEASKFLEAYETENIGYVSGLSQKDVELFRYHIRSTPCLFSVAQAGDDSYVLLYPAGEKAAIKNAMHHSNWSLRGSFGERVKEQIDYHLKGHNKINLNLEDAQKEFYIISKSNPKNYIHVTNEDVSYFKNDTNLKRISRTEPDINARTFAFMDALSAPVILEPHEFYKELGKRQEVIDTKPSLGLFPQDMRVEEEVQNYNKWRQTMSEKMGLDNENQADWALYDTAVTYSEFDTHEHLDDLEIRNFKEKEFGKMKETYKDTETRFVFDEVSVDRGSLDYVLGQIKNGNARVDVTKGREHDSSRGRS